MILSVKGGKTVRPVDIRELRGSLEREDDTVMAGYLSMTDPSKKILEEADSAGTYEHLGIKYPRIQCLTVSQILEGQLDFKTPSKIGTKIATGQQNLNLDL